MLLNDSLLQKIKTNLATFAPRQNDAAGTRKAAVALTLVEESYGADLNGLPQHDHWCREAALILTRRTQGLKHHSGQWALPGGQQERGETSEQTALRELNEEVGLALDEQQVLGHLDDFTTRSGYTITPVMVWGGRDVDLSPNPAEVASIHRIPLTEFKRPDGPVLHQIPESDQPVLFMPVGQTFIAAPTAAMLYQFREVALMGRHTRVGHYEQPYFAWN